MFIHLQMDTSELSDEKAFEHHFVDDEDDTLQASMIAQHGSICTTDVSYQMSRQASTPKVHKHWTIIYVLILRIQLAE